MRWSYLVHCAAVLAMTLAPAPPAASAEEDGTVTISGTFSMDNSFGESELDDFAPELLAVYANRYEHTWTLTLHGTTQTHAAWVDFENAEYGYITELQATSFDLEFSGPDAATLNGFVSDHLVAGEVSVHMQNTHFYDGWDGFGYLNVRVFAADGAYFHSGHSPYNEASAAPLFPTDAEGVFPVVTPEPFDIDPDSTSLGLRDPVFDLAIGAIVSAAGPVTLQGSAVEPAPVIPVVLSVADASVVEGDKGNTRRDVTVSLSRSSDEVVTVDFATADGTARTKSDYTATSGRLTFQPGQTARVISVAVKGDRKREADETLFVRLSNAQGATVGDGVATVTILNDD